MAPKRKVTLARLEFFYRPLLAFSDLITLSVMSCFGLT
jgi:hypothetical protein